MKFLHFISIKFKNLKRRIKIILAIIAVLLVWFYFSLPSKLFNTPTSFVIEDKDGNLLNAFIAKVFLFKFTQTL